MQISSKSTKVILPTPERAIDSAAKDPTPPIPLTPQIHTGTPVSGTTAGTVSRTFIGTGEIRNDAIRLSTGTGITGISASTATSWTNVVGTIRPNDYAGDSYSVRGVEVRSEREMISRRLRISVDLDLMILEGSSPMVEAQLDRAIRQAINNVAGPGRGPPPPVPKLPIQRSLGPRRKRALTC